MYVNQFYCNRIYIQEKLQDSNYMLKIDSYDTHVRIADLRFYFKNKFRHTVFARALANAIQRAHKYSIKTNMASIR